MQLNYIQAFTLNRTSLDLVLCITRSPALCSPSDVSEVVPLMGDIMFSKKVAFAAVACMTHSCRRVSFPCKH